MFSDAVALALILIFFLSVMGYIVYDSIFPEPMKFYYTDETETYAVRKRD